MADLLPKNTRLKPGMFPTITETSSWSQKSVLERQNLERQLERVERKREWNLGATKVAFECNNPSCDKASWSSYRGQGTATVWTDRVDRQVYISYMIYKQACSSCGQFATPIVYADVMEEKSEFFENIYFNGTTARKIEDSDDTDVPPEDSIHLEELCGACKSGKCKKAKEKESNATSTSNIDILASSNTISSYNTTTTSNIHSRSNGNFTSSSDNTSSTDPNNLRLQQRTVASNSTYRYGTSSSTHPQSNRTNNYDDYSRDNSRNTSSTKETSSGGSLLSTGLAIAAATVFTAWLIRS